MTGLASRWSDPARLIEDAAGELGDPGRRLATELLRDYPGSALRPAEELLEAAAVPYRLLVELVTRAGFDSLGELQYRIAEEADVQTELTSRQELGPTSPQCAADLSRLAAAEGENLRRALEELAAGEGLDLAATALLGARNRYVVGERRCYGFAHLLAADLAEVLPSVVAVGALAGQEVELLVDAGLKDVAVAFGLRPYGRATLELVGGLRRAGATVVGITDDEDGPLAALSDITLIAPAVRGGFADSPTAVAAHAHALYLLVAARARGADGRRARRDRIARALGLHADS